MSSLNLKNFIISEEVRASHAAKFLDYQDNHHEEVHEELIALLSKAWKKEAERQNTKTPKDEKRLEDVLLKNPEAFVDIEFDNEEATVGAERFMKSKTAYPSVKISLVFNPAQRKSLSNIYFSLAKEVFDKVVDDNQDAFAITSSSGNVKPVFQVVKSEDNLLKLQFKSVMKDKSSGKPHETIKTIFMIGIERGKENSKTKFFDRIFFIDYTR